MENISCCILIHCKVKLIYGRSPGMFDRHLEVLLKLGNVWIVVSFFGLDVFWNVCPNLKLEILTYLLLILVVVSLAYQLMTDMRIRIKVGSGMFLSFLLVCWTQSFTTDTA